MRLAGVLLEAPAGRCELDVALVADEQRDAELLLQTLDRPAQGRRADVALLGRSREAQRPREMRGTGGGRCPCSLFHSTQYECCIYCAGRDSRDGVQGDERRPGGSHDRAVHVQALRGRDLRARRQDRGATSAVDGTCSRKLPDAFEGIERIGVIGWGSQGPAQAQNLRDSLDGSNIKVDDRPAVRTRRRPSEARAAGFSEKDGTLGEVFEVVEDSDLVLLLIADAAQAELYPEVFKRDAQAARRSACPTGSCSASWRTRARRSRRASTSSACVRRGWARRCAGCTSRAREINGAGINCSFAVEQDVDGRATDIALAWAIAPRLPVHVPDDADVRVQVGHLRRARDPARRGVGDRRVALPPLHLAGRVAGGRVRAVVRVDHRSDLARDLARGDHRRSTTGWTTRSARSSRRRTTRRTTRPSRCSPRSTTTSPRGPRSARSCMAGKRLERFPMPAIEGTRMWEVGERVRADARHARDAARSVHGRRVLRRRDGADRPARRARATRGRRSRTSR